MRGAYYNEIDPFCVAWLRRLIAAGEIAPGEVDERSIVDVAPDDLRGFAQCHFFAGLGLWSEALRLAQWPDDRPVWTGSCPCQPFSVAGKQGGEKDSRHLWPELRRLVAERRPPVVFGEQVASPLGRDWLAAVRADLEGAAYAVGAADLCAAGVGAPQIRQRLYWVGVALGDADHTRLEGRRQPGRERADQCSSGAGSVAGRLAGADGEQWRGRAVAAGGDHANGQNAGRAQGDGRIAACGDDGGVGDSDAEHGRSDARRPEAGIGDATTQRRASHAGGSGGGFEQRPGPTHSFWRDADWLFCRDGVWRPVEPGTFPLADGDKARVGKLRAYGNAIVPQVAAAFISSVADTLDLSV